MLAQQRINATSEIFDLGSYEMAIFRNGSFYYVTSCKVGRRIQNCKLRQRLQYFS